MFVSARRLALAAAAAAALALLLGAQAAHAVNLVANPGFETGDFTGWTEEGDPARTLVVATACCSHSGTFASFFISGPPAAPFGIFQDLTVEPNSNYVIDFWLAEIGIDIGSFEVLFDGVSLMTLIDTHLDDYTHFVLSGSTDGDTTARLQFNATRDASGFWVMDDVSVELAAVPEPTTLTLFGLGLAGLVGLRRRRST